ERFNKTWTASALYDLGKGWALNAVFVVWRFLKTKLRSIRRSVKIHLVTAATAVVTRDLPASNMTSVQLFPLQEHAAVRRNGEAHALQPRHLLARPHVEHTAGFALSALQQAKLTHRAVDCHRLVAQVKQRHHQGAVAAGPCGGELRPPDTQVACLKALQRTSAHRRVLIDGQHGAIGQQTERCTVELRKVRAEDQRALGERPKRHHRLLLIWSQTRVTRLAPSWRRPQLAEGQHVRIGPLAWMKVELRPRSEVVELPLESLREPVCEVAAAPQVPEVIRDAPHVSQRRDLRRMRRVRRPRREAQHN